jgi:hypothetical protein
LFRNVEAFIELYQEFLVAGEQTVESGQ